MYSELLSLLNLKSLDERHYTVLSSQGPFEVRFYPRIVCAKVFLTGKFEEVLKEGLKHLDDYLEGSNFKVTRIEKRGPFFHIHKPHMYEVGLFLPSHANVSSAPKPLSHVVKITEIPPGRVGVLRFKGTDSPEIFNKRYEELKKWLTRKGLRHSDAYRILRNEYFISIPFLRLHEVHLDLY